MFQRQTISGIIFDLGGVILMNDYGFYSFISKLFNVSEDSLPLVIETEWNALQRGEETSVEYWRRVCGKLGVTCPNDQILASIWSKTFQENICVNDDVVNLVRKLAESYPLGIISNTEAETAPLIRQYSLLHYFSTVLLSSEVGFRKPERAIFDLASKKMQVPKQKLLLIDDDERWIKAAQEYGLQAIQFQSVVQLERSLREHGIFVN